MTKRKARSAYTRRRKVSKPRTPRSNDSGVSSSHNANDKAKKILDSNDCCAVEETDKNLNTFQNVNNATEPLEETTPASVMKRSQLTFIDDENCLDYEPSDDETDITPCVANHRKCIFNDIEEQETNRNEMSKFLPSVELKTDTNIDNINESKQSNIVSSIPGFSHSIVDSNNVEDANDHLDEDMDIESDSRNDQILEEDFDPEDEEYFSYEETGLSYKEDEFDSVNNLFGNAKVHFNGPLNITISRPVNNNTHSQVPQPLSDKMPNLNVSTHTESPSKVKIISMSISKPEQNTKEYVEKKKWSNTLSPINCPRITLNDDIFCPNMDPTLEDINTKLPFEEINSEQTRSSTTGSNILLNRGEFEMQENDKEAFVTRWLMRNNEDCFSTLLNSLCESHFSTACNNLRCSKTHSTEEIKKMIHRSSFQEFEEYYSITLKKNLWFTCLFDIFVDCFTVIPNRGEVLLIDMINDVYKVFNGTLTDKTSYVVKIIQGLQKIGFTFKQAIKRVILRYGTTQLWICDILLFIISSEPHLEDHWCLVKKITSCRMEEIDPKVVTEVLKSSLNKSPVNKEFCKTIYQDIFEQSLADFTKVPEHLRVSMAKVIGNSEEYGENVNSSDSSKSSKTEIFQPINYMSSIQRDTNEEVLQLQNPIKFVSENLSDSDASNHMAEKEDGNIFNKKRTIPKNEFPVHDTKQASSYSKTKKSKSPAIHGSKTVNNRVLKNVIKSLNIVSKPQSPANMIAHPSFQPRIDPLYQCNVSLHNLLPKVQCILTDITSTDLERLKNALRDEDTVEFLDLLQSYSDLYSIENFIVNVLTLLKSLGKHSVIYSIFLSLLNALDEMDRDYTKETYLKVTLEVLALNLIYMLSSKRNSTFSRNILLKVKDWHSLVTSKVFVPTSNSESHMGRYIFIIKVLIKAEDYCWVNEIFQAEALRLLGPHSSWPFKYKPSDTKRRNFILASFLEKCLPRNIFIANDLLKHIVVVYGGMVDGFDLWTWFSNEILALVKKGESSKSILLLLSNDINNYYERYMDKYVLQTYMLHMLDSITEEVALSLFKKCCNKGIYYKYTGEERILQVKTNFTDFEITALLECYFENFRTGRVSVHDFYIDLISPEVDLMESAMTEEYRINRSVYKIFETVCHILHSKFGIKIDQPVLYRIYVSLSMSE